MKMWHLLALSFVFGVTVVDMMFTLHFMGNPDGVTYWEMNPLARCAINALGVVPVMTYRMATLLFCMALLFSDRVRTGMVSAVMVVLLLPHLYLALVFAYILS